MSAHYIERCRDCDVVMGQCRCPGEKEVRYSQCGCVEDHREFFRKGIETITGQRREIKILNDRIKSLEEGECRFHCRMRKDMWKAGGVFVFENWHKCARPADKHLEVLYRQWRREDEPSAT